MTLFLATLASLWMFATHPVNPFVDQEKDPVVTVPITSNPSCPIMGKPISTRVYTDTDYGRIYLCCKSCIRDVQADVETAYRTAFPVTEQRKNEICPVSGDKIEEDAPRVTLQGIEFSVHSKEHVLVAKERAQITLARLLHPELVDLGNHTCPVTGEAVDVNIIVVIDDTIVRLSSSPCRRAVEEAPAQVLEQARALRAKELAEEAARRAAKDRAGQVDSAKDGGRPE